MNKIPRTLGRHALAAALLAPAASLPLHADTEKLVLEEVLVTAQKKTESLQDTPVAVNAVSGETYSEFASFDFGDADRFTAGVDISGSAFNRDIQVRGLGTNLSASVSPRVTVYVDNAFANITNGIFLQQWDLERFEFLRGPQGTLYGKASPAGAIVIHTRDPELDRWGGYVQSSVFSRDGNNSQFALNAPLIEDKLALRVSGLYDQNSSADIDNIHFGQARSRSSAGRVTVAWAPTANFDSRLSYSYIDNRADAFHVVEGNGLRAEDRRSRDGEKGSQEIRDQHATWENNWSFSDTLSLTAVTWYQEVGTEQFIDNDRGPSSDGGRQQTQDVRSNIGKVWNQEFRLSSLGNETWDWMTGIYYSNSSARTPVQAVISAPGMAIPVPPFFIPPTTTVFDGVASNATEDWGLFTHNAIHLSPATTLTLGLRYSREARSARQLFERETTITGTNTVIASASGEAIPLEFAKREFEEFTGTVKLQHSIGEDMMAYASFDRGWRGASSNIDAAGNIPAELILFDDESSINFELGFKAGYWDGRGQLTSAIYHQRYDDFQFQADDVALNASGSSSFDAVVNAKRAISQGAELETTVLLSERWSGFASVSYTDVKFDDFKDGPCTDSPFTAPYNSCDRSGERASNAPNWSAVVSSEYFLPVSSLSAEWFVRGLVKAESFRSDLDTGERLGGFGTTDLFTGLRATDAGWEVSLWAKNVFDRVAKTDVSATDANGYREIQVIDPLTIGLTGSYRWL